MEVAAASTNLLVTGCSRGLGLRFVKQYLSRRDTTVFAGVRTPSTASELLELQRQYAPRLTLVELDIASEDSIKAAAWNLKEAGVYLDVLINNAAATEIEPFLALDQKSLLDILNTNTVGPYLVIKHFLPLLRAGKQKLIANIASRGGSMDEMLEPTPPERFKLESSCMGYRVSKCALNYETAFFAKNLGPEGFTVVSIHPGWVATDMGIEGGKLAGGIIPPTSPDQSVEGVIKVLDGLDQRKDNGKFLSYKGEQLPW